MSIPDIEKKDQNAIVGYQEKQLCILLDYVQKNSPFYSELFEKNNIDISSITKLTDLNKIPFTTKDDLQNANEKFICVDQSQIVDYVTTTGTQGEPVTFALTEHDLDRLAYNEYLTFDCAELTSNDIIQLMCTMDRRFMAGLAYFLGARKLGAATIRVGNGLPELQWDSINKFKPSTVIAVPSFLLRLISYAEQHTIDINASSIKKAICIGEPIRNGDFSYNTLGKKITDKWNIQLYSTYASTEKATAFTECSQGKGGHHHPELIIIEVVDEHGEQVQPGETGELVFTTLGIEAMPLLRYKSGDLCQYFIEPCPCGRNTVRLGPIFGRKNQMIKYKGTTLYPPALYDILDDIDVIKNYYIEVTTNELETDDLIIHVGSTVQNEQFEKELKDHFRAKIRVAPSIVFTDIAENQKVIMSEKSRKPVKFIDKRNSLD